MLDELDIDGDVCPHCHHRLVEDRCPSCDWAREPIDPSELPSYDDGRDVPGIRGW